MGAPDAARVRAALEGNVLTDEEKHRLWSQSGQVGVDVEFSEQPEWMGAGAEEGLLEVPEVGGDLPDTRPDNGAPEVAPSEQPAEYPGEVPPMLAAEVAPPLLPEFSRPAVSTGWLDDIGPEPVGDAPISEEDMLALKATDPRNKPKYRAYLQEQANRAAYVEAAGERNDRLRNATGKQGMFAPPTVGDIDNAQQPSRESAMFLPGTQPQMESATPYLHQEPSIGQVIEAVEGWPEGEKRVKALNSLDKLGVDSTYYEHFADTQWKAVYNAFQESGEAAVRVEYMEPKTASQIMTYLVGLTAPTLDAIGGGLDAAVTLGLATQSGRGKTRFRAERELKEAGVLPESSVVQAMEDSPILRAGGELAGYVNPYGAGGIAVRGAAKLGQMGLKKYSNTLGKRILAEVATAGPAGMALGTAQEAIEIGGDTESAERMGQAGPTEDEIASRLKSRALTEAIVAPIGAIVPEMIGEAALKGVQRLEEGRSLAGMEVTRPLKELDIGEPAKRLPGEEGPLRGRRRYRATARPPGYKELQKEDIALYEEGIIVKPSEIQGERFAEAAIPALRAKREALDASMERDNQQFYNSVSGREPVDTSEFVGELGEIIDSLKFQGVTAEGAPASQPFPFVEVADLERAHEEFLEVTGQKLTFGDEGEIGTALIKEPIQVTAQQFDTIMKGLDAKISSASNRIGKDDWRLSRVSAALRKTYDKFGEHPVTKEPWSRVKSRHHKDMTKQESLSARFGIAAKTERLDPEHWDQVRAVINTVATKPGSDREVVRLINKNPALRKEFEALARAVGWERLKGGMSMTPGDIQAGRRAAYQAGRLYSDPVFQAMSMLRGKGNVGAIAAQDPYGNVDELARGRLGTDAERKQRDISRMTPEQRDAVFKVMDAVVLGAAGPEGAR